MIKRLKILWIKWKWVLFGKKNIKQVQKEILKEHGIEVKKPKKKFKPSNAHYASTKRTRL